MQDRGAISEREAIDHICDRVPIWLHETVRDFIWRQNRAIIPVSGSSRLPQHTIKAFGNIHMDANEVKGDNHE